MEVWYGLPNTSSEFNDTLTLENYGDEDSALQNASWFHDFHLILFLAVETVTNML